MKAWSNIQNFDNISFDDLDLLCSRFDVDSRIYLIYPKGLRHRPPATEIEVTPSYYIKFALLILDQLESNFDWKFANTLLKLSYSGKLQEKSEEYSKLAHRIVDKQPIKPLSRTKKVLFRDFETKDAPVSVPFTLLLADHAVSFAYLWAMRAYGFQPAQIIMFRNEVSARRMFLWKTAYTFDRWVRVSKYFPNNQITSLIGARFAVNDLFPLRTLRTAHTGSINDLALQELLTSSVPEKIIFSGGGG